MLEVGWRLEAEEAVAAAEEIHGQDSHEKKKSKK